MKTSAERTAENTAVLTIEIEEQDQNRIMDRGFRRVAGRAKIPGFRPGKAPRSLVERYFGKEVILQEGLEQELNTILRTAMSEANIRPYGQPDVDFESMDPLTLKVTVPLMPEVELGDYQGVRVPRETVVVDTAAIDAELNSIRERFANWDAVTDRGVNWNDRASLEITTFPADDSEQASEPQTVDYNVDAEATRPFPRFADNLIGMTEGETRQFDYQYDENETNTDWRGKNMTFRVTLKGIQEKHLPDLDDSLAQREGRFQTLDELREDVATTLQQRGESEEARRLESAVLAAIAERATVKLPAQMIENQVDAMIEDRLNIYPMFGMPRPSLEQYLNATKQSEEELREEMRPQARETLVNMLVLQKVGDENEIQVSNDEIEAEVDRLAGRNEQTAAQVRRRYRSEDQRDSLRFRLRQQKALDYLVSIAAPAADAPEDLSPTARMLLGQDRTEQTDPDAGFTRTGSGLVVPSRPRQSSEQPDAEPAQDNPEATA